MNLRSINSGMIHMFLALFDSKKYKQISGDQLKKKMNRRRRVLMTIKKKGMKGGHRVGTGASRRRFTHARSSYMTRMRRDEL